MIESAVIKQIYLGDGITTEYPFAFPAVEADHVKVAIYDIETEIETQLKRDYFVDWAAKKVLYPGYPPGEELPESERPGPLPAGKKLVIYRDTPINQLEDLGEKYPLPIVEEMADKATMILQEMGEKLERAVLVDMGGETTPKDIVYDISHLKEYKDAAAQSATEAAASKQNAAVSEQNAAESETGAAESYRLAKAWAESEESPDGLTDEDSETGLTQSSRTWALVSKADAQMAEAFAAQMEGIAAPLEWDENAIYNYPDIVAYTDGRTYRCVGTGVTGEEVPGTSLMWVSMMYGLSAFDMDASGDLMPAAAMLGDNEWEYDSGGDLMPME